MLKEEKASSELIFASNQLSFSCTELLFCHLFNYNINVKGVIMAELTMCYVVKSVGICILYALVYANCSSLRAVQYQKSLITLAETTNVCTERCISTS